MTDVHWWVKEVSTSSSVDYLADLSTEMRVPINGHKSTVTGTGGVYFKSHTSIFTYRLIYGSIYQWKDKTEGGTRQQDSRQRDALTGQTGRTHQHDELLQEQTEHNTNNPNNHSYQYYFPSTDKIIIIDRRGIQKINTYQQYAPPINDNDFVC